MAQQPNLQISYVDRPELSETFADHVERIGFDGQGWRIEFCITRMGDPVPPDTLPGKRYPTCRLVLTTNAGLDLVNKLQSLVSMMEKQGILKRTPPTNVIAPSSGKPS